MMGPNDRETSGLQGSGVSLVLHGVRGAAAVVEELFPTRQEEVPGTEFRGGLVLVMARDGTTIATNRSWRKLAATSAPTERKNLVEGDGTGCDPAQVGSGMGTRGMRERASAVDGELEIISGPGGGTKARLALSPGDGGQSSGGPQEVRILLVEDHASVRQATASVLEQEPGFRVVGQAGSLAEARKKLDGVDVAVVDLGLPDGYGGDLIRDLREASPRAQALVLSAMLDHSEIARAVESGAAGVLDKVAGIEEVVEAVRRLRAGETLMPLEEVVGLLRLAGSQREEAYEARQTIAQLTSREIEVLQALADGLDSNQVAGRLNISVKTETNHMTSILNKLGMHSRLQALVFAIRHGVVEVRRAGPPV